MNNTSNQILTGPLNKTIIKFSIPIALSSMLQLLFNAADTAVVGHFAGANALAAVGTNNELVALYVTISCGIAIGANVLLARFIGEGRKEDISTVLHTSLVLSVILGLIGLLVGVFFSDNILSSINTPTVILDDAITYLKIYSLGFPFLMLYDFGAAILRSKGDSKRPFFILCLSGIINVILNLVFVIYFNLSVAGVSLSTDISTAFSAIAVLYLLSKEKDEFKFSFRNLCFNRKYALKILTIGIPSAVQGAVFCFANIFVQASVNSFGETATAGSTISINYEYLGYYVATAFCQTATTFTSQNFGAGNKARCFSVLKKCILWSVIFTAIVTVPITAFPKLFSLFFTTDTSVIEAAAFRIRIILLLEPIASFYEVTGGFLRGIGHSAAPAIAMVICICMVRIVWICTVFAKVKTLGILFVIFPGTWILTCLVMTILAIIILKRDRLIK